MEYAYTMGGRRQGRSTADVIKDDLKNMQRRLRKVTRQEHRAQAIANPIQRRARQVELDEQRDELKRGIGLAERLSQTSGRMTPEDDEDETDFMERCTEAGNSEETCQLWWDESV